MLKRSILAPTCEFELISESRFPRESPLRHRDILRADIDDPCIRLVNLDSIGENDARLNGQARCEGDSASNRKCADRR